MKISQIEPFVESLSQGPQLRKILALALRVLAVLAGCTGLFFFLYVLGQIVIAVRTDVLEALGLLFALAIVVAVFFVAVKILLFRAKGLLLQTEYEYPLAVIASLLLKTIGELLTLFAGGSGLFAGILIWFGRVYPAIPSLSPPFVHALLFPASSFVQGLILIIASQVYALVLLVFFYLLAELLLMFRNIATK